MVLRLILFLSITLSLISWMTDVTSNEQCVHCIKAEKAVCNPWREYTTQRCWASEEFDENCALRKSNKCSDYRKFKNLGIEGELMVCQNHPKWGESTYFVNNDDSINISSESVPSEGACLLKIKRDNDDDVKISFSSIKVKGAHVSMIKELHNLKYKHMGKLEDFPEIDEDSNFDVDIGDETFISLWIVIHSDGEKTKNDNFSFTFNAQAKEKINDGSFNYTLLIPILAAVIFVIGLMIGGILYAKKRFRSNPSTIQNAEYYNIEEDQYEEGTYENVNEDPVPVASGKDKKLFRSEVSGTTYGHTVVTAPDHN